MLDPRTNHHPANSFQLFDGTKQKTQGDHDHHTWQATNSGLWPSKPSQFGAEPMEMDVDESGIISQHGKNHYRSLSPASRTQAIARGQRELMEMVKSMPETNYELSLKDLVEHHHKGKDTQENMEEERNLSVYRREGGGGSRKTAQVKGNGNIDRGGFYLKVGFPFSFGSKEKKNKDKKKKKNESLGNSSSSKVSPKPSASDGSTKGVDKEWWKKSPSALRESESGTSSTSSVKSSGSSSSSNSSSSRRSNSRREKSGRRCWPFIRRHKSQTKK